MSSNYKTTFTFFFPNDTDSFHYFFPHKNNVTWKCMCTQINVNRSQYNEDLRQRYETEILSTHASKDAAKMQSYGYEQPRQRGGLFGLYLHRPRNNRRTRVLAREIIKSCGIIRLRYIRFAFAWKTWKLNGVNYIFSKAPISVSRGASVTITENVGEITFARNVSCGSIKNRHYAC